MTHENFIKARLVMFAWAEAGHMGGKDNPLAVCHVIANRVEAGWKNGDWLQVLADAPRVAAAIPPIGLPQDPRTAGFRSLLFGVDDIYHRRAEDSLTQGALYYAQLHNGNRRWFQTNILDRPDLHPRVAKVGEVDFFK